MDYLLKTLNYVKTEVSKNTDVLIVEIAGDLFLTTNSKEDIKAFDKLHFF